MAITNPSARLFPPTTLPHVVPRQRTRDCHCQAKGEWLCVNPADDTPRKRQIQNIRHKLAEMSPRCLFQPLLLLPLLALLLYFLLFLKLTPFFIFFLAFGAVR